MQADESMRVAGEVAAAVAAATERCRWVATSTEFKPKLNNLPLTEKRFLLRKNSSKHVDYNWDVDYDSDGIYPNLVVNEDAHACAQCID
jgi:hypothetical protein